MQLKLMFWQHTTLHTESPRPGTLNSHQSNVGSTRQRRVNKATNCQYSCYIVGPLKYSCIYMYMYSWPSKVKHCLSVNSIKCQVWFPIDNKYGDIKGIMQLFFKRRKGLLQIDTNAYLFVIIFKFVAE